MAAVNMELSPSRVEYVVLPSRHDEEISKLKALEMDIG